jgi:putative colanic acid biosynthesis UDP-glucose lipid carrier transferase
MSIVGPRPHALAHNSYYGDLVENYANRHRVKPGITGWAQVHGFRGETENPEKMAQRIRCDLEYIDNWSLWFDIKILLMTPLFGLFRNSAF